MNTLTNCNTSILDVYIPIAEKPWNEQRIKHLYRRIDSDTAKQNSNNHIILPCNSTQHFSSKLYSLSGREIGTIENNFLFEGSYQIDVKASLKRDIPKGMYLFRIVTNRKTVSNSIPIS